MTREEAIAILQDEAYFLYEDDVPYNRQAFEMAIKALSQEPRDDATLKDIFCMGCEYREQEPCDDAISRKDVITAIDKWISEYKPQHYLIQSIRELLSVTQKPKTGHWIRITNGAMKEKYICSECGRQIENDGIEGLLPIKYPYCHCGAKMESEVRNDTN